MSRTVIISGTLSVILLGLCITDAVFVEGFPTSQEDEFPTGVFTIDNEPSQHHTTNEEGVRRYTGADVETVATEEGFTLRSNTDTPLLTSVVKNGIQSYILMKDGDRAGSITWVHSPNVKEYYLRFKEGLHAAFTAQVQDLVDETQNREGRPVRNLLTFLDVGLAPERLVFVRVRESLYEFHITEGNSDAIFGLIEKLTE